MATKDPEKGALPDDERAPEESSSSSQSKQLESSSGTTPDPARLGTGKAQGSDSDDDGSRRSSVGEVSRTGVATKEQHEKTEDEVETLPDHQDSLDLEEADRPSVIRTHSRASSSRSRAPTIVPRSKRRGLFAQLSLLPEVEQPYEYPNSRKWLITSIVALAGAAAPTGSGIFYPALPEMAKDFNAAPTVVNLTIALYMLAMAIFPLWWSSFSETLGRRTIYLISFALFTVFSIISAISTSIAMLIVMRILGGGASASVQAVGAGTIADVWHVKERGRAMGIFYLGPLLGPLLAPIIGGVLTSRWGWQSTMWFLTIFGALLFLLVLFCLPETLPRRRPVLAPLPSSAAPTTPDAAATRTTSRLTRMSSATRSVTAHTKRTAAVLHRCLIEPLAVLGNLRHPPIALTVFWAAVAFATLFSLNISIQSTFAAAPYSFPPLILGLLYIPPSLGYIVASIIGGRWMDRIMIRAARRANRFGQDGKPIYLPEDRIGHNAWLAGWMFPIALVWYGWTADFHVHWAVPCVANFFFGVGSMLVFGLAVTMLTEFMPSRSSGGVAVNNFVRNIGSCTLAIVTQPLLDALGNGKLFTILGAIAFVSSNVTIWMFLRNGAKWRANAKHLVGT